MKHLKLGNLFCARGVFALAFFYSLSAGLLIQLVMLPFVMPALDAGHGLLKGGDWIGFHQEAVRLADRIRHEGWAFWELRPQGNAPIGVAAAAYVLTGITEPWVLMPLNAGLFAVGATCLYMMFSLLASDRLAFAATMPYVLFPSAAVIYGQIHKDVWTIAGVTLIALVWVRIVACQKLYWKETGIQTLLTFTGVLFVWLVRPYMVQVLIVASALTVLAISISLVSNGDKSKFSKHKALRLALPLIVLIGFLKAPVGNSFQQVVLPEEKEVVTQKIVLSEQKELLSQEIKHDIKDHGSIRWQLIWQWAKLIPAFAENALSKFVTKLAQDRRGFTKGYPDAGSNIDTGDDFQSIGDVVRYIPRALQIALFAPFPDMWVERGTSPGAGHMRLISGIEMAFTYLLLPGVLLLFLRPEIRGRIIVILIQAIIPAVILTLVVSNVGTLYRMRFVNLQMLIGLGMIGWMTWLQHRGAKYPRNQR